MITLSLSYLLEEFSNYFVFESENESEWNELLSELSNGIFHFCGQLQALPLECF